MNSQEAQKPAPEEPEDAEPKQEEPEKDEGSKETIPEPAPRIRSTKRPSVRRQLRLHCWRTRMRPMTIHVPM